MSDIAIRVEGLGKQYRIGKRQASYGTLRDSVAETFAKPVRAARSLMTRNGNGSSPSALSSLPNDTIWALKDVSFDVKRGEVLGIIGRNGAGKSTLLKILSRITDPTTGSVDLYGRVGSLLEVGTGFHPELTGRENIYLNGAILGITQAELDRKLDEIVAFAEIEQFLDTPVKRYSSGMYLRLAFAAAAHLESEILLVDEVLAVGDTQFQKKCLGKMGDVAKGGRTILLVSHNMAAILSLCQRSYLLDHGKLQTEGQTAEVVEAYLQNFQTNSQVPLRERTDRAGSARARIISVSVKSALYSDIVRSGDSLRILVAYEGVSDLPNPRLVVGVYDLSGPALFRLDSEVVGGLPGVIPHMGIIVCDTEPINLSPGLCSLNIAMFVGGILADHVANAITICVEEADHFRSGRVFDRQHSLYLLKHRWNLQSLGSV